MERRYAVHPVVVLRWGRGNCLPKIGQLSPKAQASAYGCKRSVLFTLLAFKISLRQNAFRPALCPGPHWGSSLRSPNPLLGWGLHASPHSALSAPRFCSFRRLGLRRHCSPPHVFFANRACVHRQCLYPVRRWYGIENMNFASKRTHCRHYIETRSLKCICYARPGH